MGERREIGRLLLERVRREDSSQRGASGQRWVDIRARALMKLEDGASVTGQVVSLSATAVVVVASPPAHPEAPTTIQLMLTLPRFNLPVHAKALLSRCAFFGNRHIWELVIDDSDLKARALLSEYVAWAQS